MDQLQIIITFSTSIIILISALVSFIISLVRAIKNKKIAVNKINILEVLKTLIVEAENIKTLNGQEKKNYVLNKIEDMSKASELVFDAKEIGKIIDDIVAFTKMVNTKK